MVSYDPRCPAWLMTQLSVPKEVKAAPLEPSGWKDKLPRVRTQKIRPRLPRTGFGSGIAASLRNYLANHWSLIIVVDQTGCSIEQTPTFRQLVFINMCRFFAPRLRQLIYQRKPICANVLCFDLA
jgi:hypothetical protein